jgi:hypothetical protein
MKAPIVTVILCTALLCFGPASAPAQTAPSKGGAQAHKSTAGRSECVAAVGLCVTVPASWKRLGDVFEGLGFVVAEPHPGTDSASWPQLTVAAMDVPTPKNGGASPSLDSLIDIVLTPDGSFNSVETLERSRLLLNGSDAEIVRVLLHNEATKTTTTEDVALIAGDDGMVYSIALRSAPEDFARLEPIFQKTAHSWRIKAPEPATAPQSKPAPEAK